MKKADFLGKPAPPNYVAGLGRGATGFTTRSDIGPAREETGESHNDDNGLLGVSINVDQPVDKEDEEADRIYFEIESRMEQRRKVRKQTKEIEQPNQNIHEQFASAKHELGQLTESDWASIPESGAFSRKSNNKRVWDPYREQSAAIPGIVLGKPQLGSDISAHVQESKLLDDEGLSGSDFLQINKARDDLLRVRLDQASRDSESGKTTIDPKGYLTDLGGQILKSETEVGDIKRAKELLKSVIVTNPKHAPGWIAAARVEEIDGKLSKARSLIARGCEECPDNEDVWLEACRLNTGDTSKHIVANAIQHIPRSIKLWCEAARLESEVKAKRRVLRKALELLPGSVNLWKAAIDLEEDVDDARILLSRAVECVPLAVDFWIALARLESYDKAKKVLNRARISCPLSHEIWIAAAQLEESANNHSNVDMIIRKCIMSLSAKGANLSRDSWIQQAENCERSGNPVTCRAIISNSIGQDLDDEDRRDQWSSDADLCLSHGSIVTARSIFAHALSIFADDESLWREAADLESSHGSPRELEEVLQSAVRACPQAEVLWQMGAKQKWLAGDIDGARAILMEAFKANPNSDPIWLAAAKLEIENNEYERGRLILARARQTADRERVWLKSAILERNVGNYDESLKLLKDALLKYPTYPKLYMMKAELESMLGKPEAALETLSLGVKTNPKSVRLWVLLSRLEARAGNNIRARAILDKAKLVNQKSEDILLEAVQLEKSLNNLSQARAYLAKALQECPSSGRLWAEAIAMEPRVSRKSKVADALKKCENDPYVLLAGAKIFWLERSFDKARSWFQRAINADPTIGDLWAWWWKFEKENGTEDRLKMVTENCSQASPRYGADWCRISKSPENWRMKTEEILQECGKALPPLL